MLLHPKFKSWGGLAGVALASLSLTAAAVVVFDGGGSSSRPKPKSTVIRMGAEQRGALVISAYKQNPKADEDRQLAAQGDAGAQYRLALDLYRAAKTPAAYARAASLFGQSALQNHPQAITALAYLRWKGLDGEADAEEAIRLFNQAMALGDLRAKTLLGLLLSDRGDVQGMEYLLQAAHENDPVALNELGAKYETGGPSGIDDQKATSYYRNAEALGSTAARSNLTRVFVRKEYYQVLSQHLLRLAKRKDTEAMYYLGLMYHRGEGVGINYAQALHWYRKSAERGNTKARAMLGLIFNGLDESSESVIDPVWMRQVATLTITRRKDLSFDRNAPPKHDDPLSEFNANTETANDD